MPKILSLLGLLILLMISACNRSSEPEKPVDQGRRERPEFSETRPNLSPPAGTSDRCQGQLRIASFNLHSGSAELELLIEDMSQFGVGVHLWAFQEVYDWWEQPLIEGLSSMNGARFSGILSRSGRMNRLMIAYNSEVLRLDDYEELDGIQIGSQYRAPLFARFTILESGIQFGLLNNHLVRGDALSRYEQARLLNEWGRQRNDQATIAVGDYNFDWELEQPRHDPGFDLMTEDDVFVWLRPAIKVQTQCNPWYNSILDFIFLGGSAQNWLGSSKIKFHQEDYCAPQQRRSDHRPITAFLEPCHA